MRHVLALTLAGTSLLAVSCGGEGGDNKTVSALCIATGSPSTVSFQFGTALAGVLNNRVPGTRWTVKPRAASVENLGLVASGACDLAIAPADAASDAVDTDGRPTKSPLPLQALARLYDNTVQLVVPKDSNIKELSDLRNQTVSIGALGSDTEFIAERLLRAGKIRPGDLEVRQLEIDLSLAQLRDGDIQAFFWSGEVPSGRIEQFSEQISRVRLIDVGSLVPALQRQFGVSYLSSSIPAKTYAIEEDVRTVAVPNFLVASAAMDSKVAYQVTEQLFKQREVLTRSSAAARNVNLQIAIATQPVPLHRGAIQYYRDIKP
jgi:uncharacterized protein